jgi:inorganic pyrophosphatase
MDTIFMKKALLPSRALGICLGLLAIGAPLAARSTPRVTPQVSVIKGEKHYLTGYDPINIDGTVNAVIEIPAGTTGKYETDNKTGLIVLEQKNGAPRFVQYLGYPCNYGAIPRSVMAKSKGGDGDSMDTLVLGESVPTGSVVRTRILGMLVLTDTGEVDNKLVVAMEGSPFFACKNIADLDAKFPGVTTILQTWFTSYKGRDKEGKLLLSSTGFKGRAEAIRAMGDAILDFERSVTTDADRRVLDKDANPSLYRWAGAKNLGE